MPDVRCLQPGCGEVSPDYEEHEIHDAEKHWPSSVQAEAAASYVRLRWTISEALNPPDDDADEATILIRSVEAAVEYVVAQPCTCTPETVEDFDPCARCLVLGRVGDKPVER